MKGAPRAQRVRDERYSMYIREPGDAWSSPSATPAGSPADAEDPHANLAAAAAAAAKRVPPPPPKESPRNGASIERVSAYDAVERKSVYSSPVDADTIPRPSSSSGGGSAPAPPLPPIAGAAQHPAASASAADPADVANDSLASLYGEAAGSKKDYASPAQSRTDLEAVARTIQNRPGTTASFASLPSAATSSFDSLSPRDVVGEISSGDVGTTTGAEKSDQDQRVVARRGPRGGREESSPEFGRGRAGAGNYDFQPGDRSLAKRGGAWEAQDRVGGSVSPGTSRVGESPGGTSRRPPESPGGTRRSRPSARVNGSSPDVAPGEEPQTGGFL